MVQLALNLKLQNIHLVRHAKIFVPLIQVLLPTQMHTLAVAVAPTTLIMCTAVEVSHLCSAVTVAIVLEYTTAGQEMKLE